MAEHAARTLAASIPIRWLRPTHNFFTVQFDGHGVVLYQDVFGKPLAVLNDVLDVIGPDVLHVIKAAGLHGIAVGVVHLYLKTLAWETAVLKLGMEVDAAVRVRSGQDIYHEFEVLEVVVVDGSIVERVRYLAVGDQRAVLDLERVLISAYFPAGKIFSVK